MLWSEYFVENTRHSWGYACVFRLVFQQNHDLVIFPNHFASGIFERRTRQKVPDAPDSSQ
ncbi:MAG: hypothetical protein D6714_05830 [Bacteroidetes bacterium]|nr:MAG: hypothetical protein D6714_05830 [Bacteroidota bacterium]